MSKIIPVAKIIEDVVMPLPVTGTFYNISKHAHLLYIASEIIVVNGIVITENCISRAPDSPQQAIHNCSKALWDSVKRL